MLNTNGEKSAKNEQEMSRSKVDQVKLCAILLHRRGNKEHF